MPPFFPPPSGAPVQLTEKLLISAGGWEVLRHARALRETGRVNGATWSAPVLQGMVREGDREYKAGLKIKTPTNIENLCTCRPSREYGTICAHSVAVGLAIVAGMQPATPPPPPSAARPAAPGTPGPAVARPAIPPPPAALALPFRPDATATVRLHVVLAPDLSAAWNKSQLLVGLELSTAGQRTMLNPSAGTVRLLPDDFRVVEGIARATATVPGGMMFLNRAQFLEILETLPAFPRISLGRNGRLLIDSTPLKPPLRATHTPDGALELSLTFPPASRPLTANGHSWLLTPSTTETRLQPIAPGLPAAYHVLFEEKTRRLPADQAASFLSVEWPKLAPFFDLRADAPTPSLSPSVSVPSVAARVPVLAGVEPGTPAFALTIEGSLNQLGARLQATYPNGRTVTVGVTPEREAFTYAPPGAPAGTVHTRNLAAERSALARLTAWGFANPDATGHAFLRGENPILRFFALGMPEFQKEPTWHVTVGSRFTNVAKQIEVITPEISLNRSGEDWFEMQLSLNSNSGQRIPPAEIQRLLQMGKGSARLSNGKLAVLPADALSDLQEVLRDCDPSQPQPGVYRLGRAQGQFLQSSFDKWGIALAPSWEQYRARQTQLHPAAEPLLPPGLAETMRPYQRDGVRWLAFLAANGLGGILADEMGLGKTLQALAYLAAAKSQSLAADYADFRRLGKEGGGGEEALSSDPSTSSSENLRKSAKSAANSASASAPSLVVCPTSLVDNWKREAARFTPELRTLAIDGPDRAALFAAIPRHDLVVTSYALLRRDLDRYRNTEFAAVILDEAHHIKNPDSQVAQAACSLRSRHRFVLTGTPMENSVRDLWSIMHFAFPGYLGNRQDFRERYELPLSRPGDPAADAVRERLTRRLRPVLLRRRKKDVATELPDRIEQTAFCDLTPAQAEVYRGLLEQSRLKLDNARREKNKGAGRMLVLTALLRLRQACCDLRLLGLPSDCRATVPVAGDDASLSPGSLSSPLPLHASRPATGTVALQPEDASEPAPANSAKLALLDELLTEIREGGHRVLIFSQFVSMLKILSAHLSAQNTPFCYLDGSTPPRERTAQVERFQSDDTMTAFLISVKAGGVGLNLTGADTVIHFDPWWNPAVEAQATDRAHRIGQTRVVTAYRLIARGTVEEKIFALQNRKRELTASLVEREKDEPLLETLSFEEIESLLE